jgi:tetratricopeptide (TPR) repeat protein
VSLPNCRNVQKNIKPLLIEYKKNLSRVKFICMRTLFFAFLLFYFSCQVVYAQKSRELNEKGLNALQSNNIPEAQRYFEQARKKLLEEVGKENRDYAIICANLASAYALGGKLEEAEKLFLEAKNVQEKVSGKNDPHYNDVCIRLAVFYANLKRHKEAEKLFLEAIEILSKTSQRKTPMYGTACHELGCFYKNIGKEKEAEKFLKTAIHIRAEILGKEDIEYANSCYNLACLYKNKGDYKKAEPLFIEVKNAYAKKYKNRPRYAKVCDILEDIQKRKNNAKKK